MSSGVHWKSTPPKGLQKICNMLWGAFRWDDLVAFSNTKKLNCKKIVINTTGRTRYDIKSCAYGTLYNSRIKQCDFPSRVDCNANRHMAKKQNEAVVEGNRQNIKLVSMTCPPDFVGTKPHPESCQKFIECVSGKYSKT